MLVGIGDLHLEIKREGIYTGILQPVKVFYMLVGIDDLHLEVRVSRRIKIMHVLLKDPYVRARKEPVEAL